MTTMMTADDCNSLCDELMITAPDMTLEQVTATLDRYRGSDHYPCILDTLRDNTDFLLHN